MAVTLQDMIDEAVVARATQWLSLQREGQISERDRSAFLDWLRESPQHVEAYLTVSAGAAGLARACRAWTESTEVLIEKAAADQGAEVITLGPTQQRLQPVTAARRDSEKRFEWRIPLVAASLAVISVCLGWLWREQLFNRPQTFRTAHAEQRSWRLPDGSVVLLNSDSTVVVRYSQAERLVTVERGQAMFQVAKDARRRFRADAHDAQVIAVGTEFDIDRHAGSTDVAVLEGEVAVVSGASAPPAGPPTLAIAHAIAVKAGEQLDVGEPGAMPRPMDIGSARAWTQRQIVFEDRPLGAVVDEFNRYSQVPIEITDKSIRSIPVSGVFSAYDIDSFLAFLGNLEGVDVQRSPTRIRILQNAHRGISPRIPPGANVLGGANARASCPGSRA